MKKPVKNLFINEKPFVIGMIHCAPLLGYKDSPGIEKVEEKFIDDLKVLIKGGVDAIMIENNYDIPHYEKAKPSTIPHLTKLCLLAKKTTKKPLGICVLWNDYETALSIAKIAKFNFIRVPVFVDKVQTDYGIFEAKANKCIEFRKKIKAEDIFIFADVQVKHAKHLIERPLPETTLEAIRKKADAIIVTGKWTGDPPTEKDVIDVKNVANKVPVILGSGITPENINKYTADGFIIGSYFKDKEKSKKHYQNLFSWKTKLKTKKIKQLMKAIKNI